MRLQCANCHNHPLDRWTQDDYHGLAAVFARLDRGRVVKVVARGAVTNPRTGEPAVPRIPGDRFLDATADGRDAFADWLTAPDNPYFAQATVNRLWKAMFGRGLVEPADDLRDTNPATHPELLDRLAADFVKHGYDLRHTLRLIARSETYGRSAEADRTATEADDRFYSHAYRRPLEPEVLADAHRRRDRRAGAVRRRAAGHAGDRAGRSGDAVARRSTSSAAARGRTRAKATRPAAACRRSCTCSTAS